MHLVQEFNVGTVHIEPKTELQIGSLVSCKTGYCLVKNWPEMADIKLIIKLLFDCVLGHSQCRNR